MLSLKTSLCNAPVSYYRQLPGGRRFASLSRFQGIDLNE